jgi:hypothetical protein
MGTNAKDFSQRVQLRTNKVREEQVPLFLRVVTLDALSRIVLKTPVDTGRARGAWQVNINEVGAGSLIKSKSGDRTIAAGSARLTKVKSGDMIYITNDLPYIQRLERGYSGQAPSGMVRITVAEMQAAFK